MTTEREKFDAWWDARERKPFDSKISAQEAWLASRAACKDEDTHIAAHSGCSTCGETIAAAIRATK